MEKKKPIIPKETEKVPESNDRVGYGEGVEKSDKQPREPFDDNKEEE